MATDSIIDVENLAKMLEKKLDQEAQQAAEVIIAKALKEYEVELRKHLLKACAAVVDRSYDISRFQDCLRIQVYDRRREL